MYKKQKCENSQVNTRESLEKTELHESQYPYLPEVHAI